MIKIAKIDTLFMTKTAEGHTIYGTEYHHTLWALLQRQHFLIIFSSVVVRISALVIFIFAEPQWCLLSRQVLAFRVHTYFVKRFGDF